MTGWLIETLFWTAILIVLVLVLRRPVARWFGPQVAYALWAIPALRLIMPPIELPSSMRPIEPEAIAISDGSEIVILDPAIPVATTDGPAGLEAAAPDVSAPITPMLNLDLAPFFEVGVAVWLIGAAIFLVLRFSAYFRLRDELLLGASEVGRNGKVRLVETSGTQAPLAFGVIDKVIALPRGFLAQPDRTARDLALAHEMAHHEARDLLVNMIVQPLFALHWFNPLGRYGWLALRRDQEAACDARVIAAKSAEQREAYASLIVSFAAGPETTLAAPMACPVLGEKSIIHRLRSLKMSDTSKNRRLTGRLMVGAAVIALPLTATISYAASEAPLPPQPPIAPGVSVTPPAPPAPPVPPAPPALQDEVIVDIDPDLDAQMSDDTTREMETVVIRSSNKEIERELRDVERVVIRNRQKMSEAEIEEVLADVREGLEEANRALEDMPRIINEARLSIEEVEVGQGRTIVKMECDRNSSEVATTIEKSDGQRMVLLCQSRVMAHALTGIKQAREEIARNRDMSKQMRERVLRELDQQIDAWEDEAR